MHRLTRLEVSNYYEFRALNEIANDLSRRLWRLESAPQRALDSAGYLKLALALLLPLGVFLVTGSAEKALTFMARP